MIKLFKKSTSFNWKDVARLPIPLQTSKRDVIFSGNGVYKSDGFTRIFGGIELWTLAPYGAAISKETNLALTSGSKIIKLGLGKAHCTTLINSSVKIFQQGEIVPNYILYPIQTNEARTTYSNVIDVFVTTKLSDLFLRLLPLMEPGKVVRCFWNAYTAITNPDCPLVFHQ